MSPAERRPSSGRPTPGGRAAGGRRSSQPPRSTRTGRPGVSGGRRQKSQDDGPKRPARRTASSPSATRGFPKPPRARGQQRDDQAGGRGRSARGEGSERRGGGDRRSDGSARGSRGAPGG